MIYLNEDVPETPEVPESDGNGGEVPDGSDNF